MGFTWKNFRLRNHFHKKSFVRCDWQQQHTHTPHNYALNLECKSTKHVAWNSQFWCIIYSTCSTWIHQSSFARPHYYFPFLHFKHFIHAFTCYDVCNAHPHKTRCFSMNFLFISHIFFYDINLWRVFAARAKTKQQQQQKIVKHKAYNAQSSRVILLKNFAVENYLHFVRRWQ